MLSIKAKPCFLTKRLVYIRYAKDGTVILWPGVASFQLLVFATMLLLE